jgi:hypothetical protein
MGRRQRTTEEQTDLLDWVISDTAGVWRSEGPAAEPDSAAGWSDHADQRPQRLGPTASAS